MSIGLSREECGAKRKAFVIAVDALIGCIKTGSYAEEAGGAIDISREALKKIRWLSGINPDDIDSGI